MSVVVAGAQLIIVYNMVLLYTFTMNANTRLFLFCRDTAIDPVAPHVYARACAMFQSRPITALTIEGAPVQMADLTNGDQLCLATTSTVPSYMYPTIAPELNEYFHNAAVIVVVNWHAGANAPERIFCAHTTADVVAGHFPSASATELTALLKAVEGRRAGAGLTSWRTLFEASHWSGSMVGRPAEELLAVRAPVVDYEIGSSGPDWGDPVAHQVMASAIGDLRTVRDEVAPAAVFIGGTHFEPSLSEAILTRGIVASVGHVLPNQWLVAGGYEQSDAVNKLVRAVQSFKEPVRYLVMHDGLKGPLKATVRAASEVLGIPLLNHRAFREGKLPQPNAMKEAV